MHLKIESGSHSIIFISVLQVTRKNIHLNIGIESIACDSCNNAMKSQSLFLTYHIFLGKNPIPNNYDGKQGNKIVILSFVSLC